MASPNTSIRSLQVLLGLGLVAWVAIFIFVHGWDVILPYLCLQIATSGVFAFFMWKAEHSRVSADSNREPVMPDAGKEQQSATP
ncbi:MAG: hypothetical protein VB858_12885 [Planctomycetaceae bacterium]